MIIFFHILAFLSIPSKTVYYFTHLFFGIEYDGHGFSPGFGGACIDSGCGLVGIKEFLVNLVLSFSGSGWSIPSMAREDGFFLLSTLIFFFLIFIVATSVDNAILIKIAKNHTKKRKSYNTAFMCLYSFWRIFLPDFFVFGGILAKICNINLSEEVIQKLNTRIQLARIGLFSFFMFFYFIVIFIKCLQIQANIFAFLGYFFILYENNFVFMVNSAELIMAYAQNTPNRYIMENSTIRYKEVNRVCSDVVEVFLKIENNTLIEFSFDGYMSVTATACIAITGELLLEQSLDDILGLNESFIHENIGTDISPRRRYASLIGLLAIKNAIHQYKQDGKTEDFSDIEI